MGKNCNNMVVKIYTNETEKWINICIDDSRPAGYCGIEKSWTFVEKLIDSTESTYVYVLEMKKQQRSGSDSESGDDVFYGRTLMHRGWVGWKDHKSRKMWKERKKELTCHSRKPWMLSGLDFLTATALPTPTLVGARVLWSTQPLKTRPKPPSPSIVSGLKFLVAALRSCNVNIFK